MSEKPHEKFSSDFENSHEKVIFSWESHEILMRKQKLMRIFVRERERYSLNFCWVFSDLYQSEGIKISALKYSGISVPLLMKWLIFKQKIRVVWHRHFLLIRVSPMSGSSSSVGSAWKMHGYVHSGVAVRITWGKGIGACRCSIYIVSVVSAKQQRWAFVVIVGMRR